MLLFDGDHASSRPYLEESVGIWRALGATGDLAYSLMRLGRAALLAGDVAGAAAALGESQALWRELGWAAREAGALHDLGCVALAPGDTLGPMIQDSSLPPLLLSTQAGGMVTPVYWWLG